MELLVTLPAPVADHVRRHKKDYPGIADIFSDPEGKKLGSGGGTVNVLWTHYKNSRKKNKQETGKEGRVSFKKWLSGEKRIIVHSDGQSRRLPAYSTMGKSFIPFPVFKWGRGQHIRQTLLDIQKPLLERIMNNAPKGMNTMIVSGDAVVYYDRSLPEIPYADVVCIGIWAQPETASKHGVFICPRHDPTSLEYMLQKPSTESLQSITGEHLFLLDAGIWLLSDKAVRVLFKNSGFLEKKNEFSDKVPGFFDLYSDFGKHFGKHPEPDHLEAKIPDQTLTSKVVPLNYAEFYHFGSNTDLISSSTALHNLVTDQREIWHKKIKPSKDIFIQNSITRLQLKPGNGLLWIENSFIPDSWKLNERHIISGIPENGWKVDLSAGVCLDFIPIGATKWCIRFYGFNDTFRGKINDPGTRFLERPAGEWFNARGIPGTKAVAGRDGDIYEARLFPILDGEEITEDFIQWLINDRPGISSRESDTYLKSQRLSCEDIIRQVNHKRLQRQSNENLKSSLKALSKNYRQSIFFQLDMMKLVEEFIRLKLPLPAELPDDEPLMIRIHDCMFRSTYLEKSEQEPRKGVKSRVSGSHLQSQGIYFKDKAFELLKSGIVENIRSQKLSPRLNVQHDQIIWGRSPVRLDLAGGWTDTPPYCILFGGKVVNAAVELNGQPPLQVFIRPKKEPEITIRSIDLGVSEVIRSYKELEAGSKVGSAFSIPKTAIMLSGFHPGFSAATFKSLKQQLQSFGGGFDISLMVAVPKGSGLGTSSILASTVLGTLSEFCNLGWDRHTVAERTLVLEQILTTGGGWQDQFGGIFEGIKLIESIPGFIQKPSVKWAPEHLFTNPASKELILLYYTGISRIAKRILQEIVRGMFLNSSSYLQILSEMKQHAVYTYDAIQNHDWGNLSRAINHSWDLNQRLDKMTKTGEISSIIDKIEDHMSSCKLLGAGGGGYMMILAKDSDAAGRIRSELTQSPPNNMARFVDWELSRNGFKLSKS